MSSRQQTVADLLTTVPKDEKAIGKMKRGPAGDGTGGSLMGIFFSGGSLILIFIFWRRLILIFIS